METITELTQAIERAIAETDPGTARWRELAYVDGRWTPREIISACRVMNEHGRNAIESLRSCDWLDAIDELWAACHEETKYGGVDTTWAAPHRLATQAGPLLRVGRAGLGYPGQRLHALPLREGETTVSLATEAPARLLGEARDLDTDELVRRILAGERWGLLPFPRATVFALATVTPPRDAEFPHVDASLQGNALRLALADQRKDVARMEARIVDAVTVVHAAVTTGTWSEDLPPAMQAILDARRMLPDQGILDRGTHLGRLMQAAVALCEAHARSVATDGGA